MRFLSITLGLMWLSIASLHAEDKRSLEERVEILEEKTQELEHEKLSQCELKERYRGSFYNRCPRGSFVEEVRLRNDRLLVRCAELHLDCY